MDDILQQAEQMEKNFDWRGAIVLYERIIGLLPKDDSWKTLDGFERLGYAFYHSSFQADANIDFVDKLRRSRATYEKALELDGDPKGPAETAKIWRCKAMIAYLDYWLASEALEKKSKIDECWKLAIQALNAFEAAGERAEYGRTFNQFSKSADLSFCFEWGGQTREKLIKEAIGCGERAIVSLATSQNENELAKAYVKTADYLYAHGYAFLGREDQERQFDKARRYWKKANEICSEAATLEALSILQGLMMEFATGADDTLSFYQKAMLYAKRTADRLIMGNALDMLAYHTNHKAWVMTEDPDEMIKLAERAQQYGVEAKQQYSVISFVGPGGYGFIWVEEPTAEYYCMLASKETDPDKRQELARTAAQAGQRLLERAQSSGYADAVWYSHHVMGKISMLLAGMESDVGTKTRLLDEALKHRSAVFNGIRQVSSSMFWERGLALGGIGGVKSQLADLVSDPEIKRKMLFESIEDEQESFNLLAKGIVSYEKKDSMITILGYTQYQCGLLLNQIYEFTHNKEYLTKAAEAFEEAAIYYRKFDLAGRVAECHWKTARTRGILDQHLKAADSFRLASDSYRQAAENIPPLKAFYEDNSLYMRAWSEIEKARNYHEKQEYGQAKECFEKAATLHGSLKRWSFLKPNYSAWALVEEAEELSRKEQSSEAIKAFGRASQLFTEAKRSGQMQLNKVQDHDEKLMANSVIKTSSLRKEYCDARVALEDAKILDKQGDHFGSSKKYGVAAEAFERIFQDAESEQERQEFRSIITLSRAWQKMMIGDAKASPEMYLEASDLFEQASKESESEVTSLLALGHSRFCKALEAGTRFADTGNMVLQTTAAQNLETAAKYYVKAGFHSASEYAKATGLLFDAYVQMDAAKEEKDPEKKTRFYLIAEKILQTSAGSFMKAEHPEKREQVLKLLEKVREEKELALSIAEVLHASTIVSTTTSFNAMTPSSEEALGSERFEHADVQVNLMVMQRELKIGESVSVELELVNAGKGSALLTKVTDVIPKGFQVVEKTETFRVEDNYINLKGKRLDPLKSEEVKLVLKPTLQGTFSLRPTVLYLDENGKYKSCEPEPVSLVVKELGMKNWLKGDR